MNDQRFVISGLLAVCVSALSACALPKQPLLACMKERTSQKSTPLLPGHKYEVRPALAPSVPFRPLEIQSYTFVVENSKPLLTASSKLNRQPKHMQVRTTAYTHNESDHIIYGVKNAIGTNLKFGSVRSAAADWSRFPVGTKFRISGQPNVVYEVDDYGSALVGTGTIDLYKPSKSMMDDWGVRHVDIEVIQWGSYERSMQLMRDRTKWKHVRSMMEGIEARLRTAGLPAGELPFTASL